MDNKNITYGKLSDLNLKTLIALSRTTNNVHKREYKTIKEGGLTVSQFSVLEVLYHKGDLKVAEIIDKTLSTGGNMTVVIENLVKDGLVTRYKDPEDKRINFISITKKGKDIIDEIFPKHIENINEIFSSLTIEEKQSLIGLLKKLSGV
ncbi:MarR family winged helix-turn-helix transcriptional regulator [Clostridium sp. UBA4548]|uniref:MarR family winged helix-turn-helix transcriptional regulator n=1 Tax=Clostridium sp. UBA4548 TaxID=1946361 RepID=UPI0025C32C6E|nr:MarR family transcriptional regulator [Clostridium sp. UBA4548]